MGIIYQISCDCGYSKELFIGAGMVLYNIDDINKIFPSEKLDEFNNYFIKNKVQSFTVKNEACRRKSSKC